MGCVYSRSCVGEVSSPKNKKFNINKNKRSTEIAVFSPDSSDGESGDQLSHLGIGDTEVGITRLSRVSSQFLPPEGSRKVKIPSGDYEIRYSYLSQRGYYPDALDKANQDSFCIHSPFGTNPNDHFFGVFDGHGEYGAECSQFTKQKICENLLRSSRFHIDAFEACNSAFLNTNSQLHADKLDDSMSGTTAVTILVRGKTLYAANSGDSRAIIAEKRGEEIVAVDLSIDHTPFRVDELERVKLCGARVLTLDQIEGLKNPEIICWGTEEADDGDPPRLWVENGMYPGTAFTRSIGDSIAETIGVIANPEIVAYELTKDNPFFVIASDGVFEFLSSQTVVDMVAKYKDPRDACAAIVAESYRLWLQYETRTDDITVIVVHVNGLTDASDTAASPLGVVRSPISQVVEIATGSESPSPMNWSTKINRARNDLSRARVKVLENSLENNGQIWVPPSPSHRKTWEEEAHIQRVLHDHFLFRKLTDSQSHVLLDCMQRLEIQPGEIVVQQGGEGDCFYVVGYGELEVLATQEEKNGDVQRVLQRYTAEKLSSFGELALMYNKPLQASVRAVTSVTLWALRREDFRGILMSKFSNLSSLKLLRSVDLLSRLTILQLSQISDCLSEVSFSNGQAITNMDAGLLGLYIIQKGRVKITFDAEAIHKPNTASFMEDISKEENYLQKNKEFSVEKNEGSYFGEWMLLGEKIVSISAVAVGDVTCAILTKEKFDAVVGPLTKFSRNDHKPMENSTGFSGEPKSIDPSTFGKVELSELDWKKSLYSTDCSDIGLVHLKSTGNLLSLKRFSKHKVKNLGKEALVLKEKNLIKSLTLSASIPRVLCTCADKKYVGILLNTRIACPISSIINSPLEEMSAKFCAASLVVVLEDLHQEGILYRGVTADVMLDQTGYIQLVDFRFGKKISEERTFTICGTADFLAPEIVQGKGHSFPVDWWALGVLIHFMLLGEMPFGSWRENELETFAKIAKGQLCLPQSLSSEAIDLITKLLEVEESTRLGTKGAEYVKTHPWFNGINWKNIRDQSLPVPKEILSLITQQMENYSEESGVFQLSSPQSVNELDSPEWLEDW